MPRLSRFVLALVLLAALLPQIAIAQAPSITITTPQPSEIVGAGSVFVAGSGTALFENNVVIQALDYSGIVLGQTNATVDAELGGSGPWSAQLMLRVPPGTPGRIYVFSQSPADGSIIADAGVDVMFGGTPPPPTDTPAPPPTDTPWPTPTDTPWPTPTDTPLPPPTDTPAPPPTNTPVPPPTNTAIPIPTNTPEPPPVSMEITIRIPIPGETVSNRQVVVSGTGTGLPENTVVVQALDSRGRIIAQRATIVQAPLGGFGPWSVTLDYEVSPGTPGIIYAFAQSPADGSIMADATVPVTFGQYAPPTATSTPAPPTPLPTSTARPPTMTPTRLPPTPVPLPFISIDMPRNGEVVSPIEVVVSGSGVALPENNVVIQALDTSGRILGQRATTVNAPLGGSGRWSTVVQLNVRPGTPGRIYAFATSPANGRVIADASVSVRFGATPPPTPTPIAAPSITIERPANGSNIDAGRPFAISGVATSLFENNVVVRIRDAFGRTLRQIATTADRNGRWAVTAEVRVPDSSPGSIYAFSTSPATGSVVTDDLVQVTFVVSCQVRTDWPVYIVQPGDNLTRIAQNTGSTVPELIQANCLTEPAVIYVGQPLHVPHLPGVTPPVTATPALEIIAPEVNDELTPNTRFNVAGEAAGVTPDLVFARLLDANGNVLSETRTENNASAAGNAWQWSANLLATNVQPGTVGQVFVYAVSPSDGSIVVSAATPVRFGPDDGRPYIAIDSPLPYSTLPIDGPVVVRGVGRGLFENNVVVQAIDNNGNILITQPVTMKTAEVGGEGQWAAELPIEVVTRGHIVAFSPSPDDGRRVAEAAIDVYFGDPAAMSSAVWLNYPLPGTIITNRQPVVVASGSSTGVRADSLQLLVQDTNGEVLQLLPVEVDTITGAWSISWQLDAPIQADHDVWMQIIGRAIDGSTTPLTDRILVQAQRADAEVTGSAVYRERMALPEGSKVTVQLYNASLADAPPEMAVIGEQVIEGAVGSPIPFVVPFASADVIPGAMYSVSARIEDANGQLLFISTTTTPVITNGNPVADVEVMLQRVP